MLIPVLDLISPPIILIETMLSPLSIGDIQIGELPYDASLEIDLTPGIVCVMAAVWGFVPLMGLYEAHILDELLVSALLTRVLIEDSPTKNL